MKKYYYKFIILLVIASFIYSPSTIFAQNTTIVTEKISVFQTILNAILIFGDDIKEFVKLQRNPEIPVISFVNDKPLYVREPIDPSIKPAYISKIFPSSAKKGNVVAIDGANFKGVTKYDVLIQSGTTIYNPPHVVVKDKRITFIVPTIPIDNYKVSVYGRGGLSNSVKFSVLKSTQPVLNTSSTNTNTNTNTFSQSQYNSFFESFYLQNSDVPYIDFDYSNFDPIIGSSTDRRSSSRNTIPLLTEPKLELTPEPVKTITRTKLPLLPELEPVQPDPIVIQQPLSGTVDQTPPNINAPSVNITSYVNGEILSTGNIRFTGSASGGSGVYDYIWNFGDGGMVHSGPTEGGIHQTYHYYYNPGVYEVSLSVKDTAGAVSNTHQINIIVN
jgi:hypothetical protein